MKFAYSLAACAAFSMSVAATPAFAQAADAESAKADAPELGVFDGDWITVGIGGGYAPSYEGSDDYTFFPAPIAQGSIGGFDFGARGPGLYVDLIADGDSDSNVKFLAGPLVRVRLDRNSNIKDPVHPVVMQGNETSCTYKGGGQEFELKKDRNAYFNSHIKSSGSI